MKRLTHKNMILSAMFIAIGVILPTLTGQIKEIGDTLLPMHIPVMLCGLVCGQWWGLASGAVLPFLRSALFSMPPLYPNALWMAAELAAYGFVSGFVYCKSKKTTASLYVSLITAMLSGRVVWALVKALLLSNSGKAFTFAMFISGGFVDALPGIVLQLVLIPFILKFAEKPLFYRFYRLVENDDGVGRFKNFEYIRLRKLARRQMYSTLQFGRGVG
jgi:predicted membrane protein